jgi:hypothetical protein
MCELVCAICEETLGQTGDVVLEDFIYPRDFRPYTGEPICSMECIYGHLYQIEQGDWDFSDGYSLREYYQDDINYNWNTFFKDLVEDNKFLLKEYYFEGVSDEIN